MKPNVVIGLGNPIFGDDGIGYHVAGCLADDPGQPEDTDILQGGTDLLRLEDQMKGRQRVVLVDSMLDSQEPGSVSVFQEPLDELEDMRQNAHHLSLVQAIKLLRIASPALQGLRFTLIAVAVESVNATPELSPPLAAKLPEIVRIVRQELENPVSQDVNSQAGNIYQ